MNKKTKKIIAKEFLFLLGTTILFFVVLFIWVMLHESNYDKKNELKDKISELTIYEKLPYRLRVFYYINNDIIKNSWDKMSDSEKFIFYLKDKKQASETYEYIKEKGNISITKDEFLEKISKDSKSENYLTKIQPLERKLEETKDSFFNISIGDDEILGLGVFLFSIFFLLRYLIYGTKWSIKQLKE